MRVLLMSDHPGVHTGMARVHREVGRGLKKHGHEVFSIGWFFAHWMEDWTEWRVFKTNNNYYGSDVFDQVIWEVRPDIVLTIGDIWMVSHIADQGRCRTRGLFRWVGYVPIDGEARHGGVPNSWNSVLLDMDQVVAYTEYGKDVILKSLPELSERIRVIPHGVDTGIYKPQEQAIARQWRHEIGIPDDFVVFLMVARNQFRKNIPEFCKAWVKFRSMDKGLKVLFWPHMIFKDPMGWDLWEIFEIYGMKQDLIYYEGVANSESNVLLVDEGMLAKTYNMSDVFVLLSGEGFGLPTLEAMACGKPVVLMEHSANIELGRGRGLLTKISEHMTGNHSTERPYPHIDSVAQALMKMYRDEQMRLEFGCEARKFAETMTWDSAGTMWDKVLTEVENPFSRSEVLAEVVA